MKVSTREGAARKAISTEPAMGKELRSGCFLTPDAQRVAEWVPRLREWGKLKLCWGVILVAAAEWAAGRVSGG